MCSLVSTLGFSRKQLGKYTAKQGSDEPPKVMFCPPGSEALSATRTQTDRG